MAEFKGMLRLVGDQTTLPAAVEVSTGEIHIRSSDTALGTWLLSDVGVEEREDGFLLTVEDGQLLLTPFDRSGFADTMTVEKKAADKAARKRRRRWGSRRKRATTPEPTNEDTASEAPPTPTEPLTEPADKARPGRRWRRKGGRRRNDTAPTVEANPSPSPDEEVLAPPDPPTEAGEVEAPASGAARLAARVANRIAVSTRRERIVGIAVLAVLLLAVFAARVLTILVLVGGGLVVLLGILAYVDDYVAVKIPSPWTPLRVIGLGLGVLAVGGVIPLVLL